MLFTRKPNQKSPMGIKARNNILIFVFVFILAFSIYDNARSKKSVFQKDETPKAQSVSDDIDKYHNNVFTVIYVVDGDTIDINIADGKYSKTRVRLLGVDTPETKHPNQPKMYYGDQATDFVKSLVLNKKATIILDDENNIRDRYGRLLAYVKLENKSILNEEIVINGFGYTDHRFKHKHIVRYKQLQEDAVVHSKGLWKNVQFHQLPYWMQKKCPEIVREKLLENTDE